MSRFPSNVRFQYLEAHSSNFTRGNWRKDHIVLHWWNEPRMKPQFDGVVSWFRNPTANVSIQYMVEANRITQMIPESAMAWHSGNNNSNRHGIGIEVNPRLNAGDYETTAVLVAEIERRLGRRMPLRRHRDVNSSTACPGHMDVARIRRRADQIKSGGSSTPTPTSPVLEGEVMSASDVWGHRGLDYVNDNASTKNAQLARAHEYAWRIWGRIRNNDWRSWLATGVMRWRGLDYVNDNPSSKDAQIARAHQYSMQARSEIREVKAMVRAMAKAQDELLQGQGKILKAVEDAEQVVIQANAAEVAAELEVTVRESEEED